MSNRVFHIEIFARPIRPEWIQVALTVTIPVELTMKERAMLLILSGKSAMAKTSLSPKAWENASSVPRKPFTACSTASRRLEPPSLRALLNLPRSRKHARDTWAYDTSCCGCSINIPTKTPMSSLLGLQEGTKTPVGFSAGAPSGNPISWTNSWRLKGHVVRWIKRCLECTLVFRNKKNKSCLNWLWFTILSLFLFRNLLQI